jgi:hypothetical protein
MDFLENLLGKHRDKHHGAQDLTGLLANLPKLLTTLLVEAPKAMIEYLGPLLKLKTALEGAG